MALDFPNSPTNGQIFSSGTKKWTYSTAQQSWLASNYAPSPENVNGIVKSDGAGNFSAAVAGTDYLTSATLASSPATAKAWVNWTSDGTSTGAINVTSSYNVTSVSRVGTSGDDRYAFDINIPAGTLSNANYTWFASGRENDDSNEIVLLGAYKSDTKTTTKLRLISKEGASGTSITEGNVVIFA